MRISLHGRIAAGRAERQRARSLKHGAAQANQRKNSRYEGEYRCNQCRQAPQGCGGPMKNSTEEFSGTIERTNGLRRILLSISCLLVASSMLDGAVAIRREQGVPDS